MIDSTLRAKIYRYALHLTRNHALAEDIAQETLIKVWRYPAENHEAVARLAAKQLAISEHRRKTWRKETPLDMPVSAIEPAVTSTMEAAKMLAAIDRTIEDPLHREILRLSCAGARNGEIAETCRLTPGSVAAIVFRAKARMRLALAEDARALGIRYRKTNKGRRSGRASKNTAASKTV